MKTMIAAVDFSDASMVVIKAAEKMAKSFGATLHLVHVVESQPSYAAYGFTPEEFPVLAQVQQETVSRAEVQLREYADSSGVEGVQTNLLQGSPLHTILEFADECGADLLVLGSHGHGVLGSLFLGSVAEGCVRKAKLPTLVIPVKES
ncbi:universal stress protein [Verrucomicrobiaceae bacterium R5-34]|uniref:Universal stress protein n=1 Tax=Oceaniferula flava TaxID=2800421 RepID=A0AAE2SHN4_9BACT|nr:universal stress protein [Oceaniferula flavus]MBK1832371.1 universal stress protein [Verrucomicrobiaceae bacterium R5-34]MBK1856551.1 universal stress protein [Oceaniferula flavus]MBM1137858.1 universal stress protein [Oceaniferula flavus]